MLTLADRLRLAVLERASAFEDQVDDLLAGVDKDASGLIHALQLFRQYSVTLRDEVKQSWDDTPDTDLRVLVLHSLMDHFRVRSQLFDDRFSRTGLRVPRALAATVERACEEMGLAAPEAVITVGPPGNFVTFVADLRSVYSGTCRLMSH